jgi:hypothetical protein
MNKSISQRPYGAQILVGLPTQGCAALALGYFQSPLRGEFLHGLPTQGCAALALGYFQPPIRGEYLHGAVIPGITYSGKSGCSG